MSDLSNVFPESRKQLPDCGRCGGSGEIRQPDPGDDEFEVVDICPDCDGVAPTNLKAVVRDIASSAQPIFWGPPRGLMTVDARQLETRVIAMLPQDWELVEQVLTANEETRRRIMSSQPPTFDHAPWAALLRVRMSRETLDEGSRNSG